MRQSETPTRGELVALCEAASRPESVWHDRDSAGAQRQVGEAWALLRAGCDFSIDTEMDGGDRTIWLRIKSRGFRAVEYGPDYADEDLFYIPTQGRLDSVGEKDWY